MDTPVTHTVFPKAPGERIAWLDALRGLSIWGIALINVQFFAMSFMRLVDWRWSETPATENLARAFLSVFAERQFFHIFAMLFGVGMWFQYARSTAAGRKGGWLHVRRMAVLLAFGLAHGVLLWYGDILAMYALVGLVAWLWIRRSSWGLIGWALLLLAVPLILNVLLTAASPQGRSPATNESSVGPEDPQTRKRGMNKLRESIIAEIRAQATAPAEPRAVADEAATGPTSRPATSPADSALTVAARRAATAERLISWVEFLANDEAVYRQGRFGEMVLHRSIFFLVFSPGVALSHMGWTALGMMLLGIWLARSGMWDLMSRPQTAFLCRWLAWLTLVPGTALQVFAVALGAWKPDVPWIGTLRFALTHVGSLVMTVGYVAGFVALYSRPGWPARLKPLVAVGRMSLTNYLGTSLLLGLVFYGYGLGLIGRVGFVTAELIALAVLTLLTLFSVVWLRFCWFGPLEWLWRALTYLRRPA